MKKYLKILEFDKICEKLEAQCQTPLGKELARTLMPSVSIEDVEKSLRETTEGKTALEENDIYLQGTKEIRPFLSRVKKGGQLKPNELWEIGQFCLKAEKIRKAMSNVEKRERYRLLFTLSQNIADLSLLQREISKCLGPGGELLDDASTGLKKIRKEIRNLQEQVKEKLDNFLKSPSYRKYLQDFVVVERGERFVLPVKQEYQRQIPGLVHDRSSSGATLFIEPYPLVELNNKINLAHQDENKEIDRILQLLSLQVAGQYENLFDSWEAYGQLDFILARASLSITQKANPPKLAAGRFLSIIKGKHPLLKEDAVPVDINLGGDFSTLVITGPNTGGKTVTLKMVGLMAMMTQAGLHIPAEGESEFCVFDNILADIGDEQNIEQSLSTFSGHMVNIIDILKKATPASLVLLDELGAGTDPSEGSGLAMAILEELYRVGALVIATSHFNELKVFAYQTKGMKNASVEFDDHTLKPTYKILLGIPGSSKASLIAERLGLPKNIILRSKEFQRSDILDVENVVSRLVLEQKKYSRGLEEVSRLKNEAERAKDLAKKEEEGLEEKKITFSKKAKEEAAAIVRQAKKEVKDIITRMKALEKEEQRKSALYEMEKEKARLEKLETTFLTEENSYVPLSLEELTPGQAVYVKSLAKNGHIIDKVKDTEEIQVQVGLMKVTTRLQDLAKIREKNNETEKKGEKHGLSSFLLEKNNRAAPEIDLRGCTVNEAIELLSKYFDDAELAGFASVRIIHGKGTGSLREGIHSYLEGYQGVQGFRLGESGEGGSGVTVVFLSSHDKGAGE